MASKSPLEDGMLTNVPGLGSIRRAMKALLQLPMILALVLLWETEYRKKVREEEETKVKEEYRKKLGF